MSEFDSLISAYESWFDKPLGDLPEALRQRVGEDFFPQSWDEMSADQRRSIALQYDYQHDPATEKERQFWWDFFKRKSELEKQIAKWQSVDAPTASELAMKETRLAELRQELAGMEQQRQRARSDPSANTCQPVSAAKIMAHFQVIKDADRNDDWWKKMMRDAKRNGLAVCRVGEGKKGQGGGSLWRPELVAGWLVDRQRGRGRGMSISAARTALMKFPGCKEAAENQFPSDEEGSR